MFAITNALNGLDMNAGGVSPGNGPIQANNGLGLDTWSIPGATPSPKKVKTKKSKSSLTGGVSEATKRARAAASAFAVDQGVLGGF